MLSGFIERNSKIIGRMKDLYGSAKDACQKAMGMLGSKKPAFSPKISLSVFCPMQPCVIQVRSPELENSGKFTNFIIYAVGKGHSPRKIADTIELGIDTVKSEMDWLADIGLMDGDCRLTAAGNEIFQGIVTFRHYNSQNCRACLNRFTGEIEDCAPAKGTESRHILPPHVSPKRAQAWQYGPLLEYLAASHGTMTDKCEFRIAFDGPPSFAKYEYSNGNLYDRQLFKAEYKAFSVVCGNAEDRGGKPSAGASPIRKSMFDPLDGHPEIPVPQAGELPTVELLETGDMEGDMKRYLDEITNSGCADAICEINEIERERTVSLLNFRRI